MAKRSKGEQELPRHDWVYGLSSGKVSSLTIAVHPSGEIVVNEIDVSTIRRQITTVRPSGKDDKVRYSVPGDDFGLSLTHAEHLKTKFDYILAADTNTLRPDLVPKQFSNYTVSACTVTICRQPLKNWRTDVFIEPLASYIILDSDPNAKAELLGWHLALTRHTNTPFLHTQRLGLVVDSELGRHIDINARTAPYYANHLLPDNISLVYASSDSSDTVANQMLKCSDSCAKQVLSHFLHHGITPAMAPTAFKVGTATCFHLVHPDRR